MHWTLFQLLVGLLLLSKAADWFARGLAHVAELTGLSRLLLGAVLVGFVTNLPEFFVSTGAAWKGHGELAFGNPVGSNIFDTAVILGLCLVRTRMPIQPDWLRDQGIPMWCACLALYALAALWDITLLVAVLLLVILGLYLCWSLLTARRNPAMAKEAKELAEHGLGAGIGGAHRWAVAFVLFGLSFPLLFLSSRWVLGSAVELARLLEVSEAVVGLTMIAAGTSLPELATSLAATRRDHLDTAVGIIFGSNVYNALGVVGLSGLIAPLPITAANRLLDLPVMMLVMTLLLAPLAWGRLPGRRIGCLLIALYGAYVLSLFMLRGVFEP
jgi:cation:H+ antiporter